MAEYRHFAKPDPEWVEFPKNLPPNTRIVGMNRERLPIKPQEGLDIIEFDVPVRDGHPIRLRQYRQSKIQTPLPLFINIHGGGWVTGSLETDDAICRTLAAKVPVSILQIEYRLAPEHKFPVGFEDSHDIVKWVASEAGIKRLNVDLSRGFILGGTSAGSNFTAGISHLVRDENLTPALTGLVLLAGNVCHPDARPAEYRDRILSIDEINDAPGLTRKSIDYFAGKYGAPADDKRLSPLLFPSHECLGKKAYFAICGWDPRRDESILFQQLLEQAGTETKHHIYPGLPHGFWTTCPDLPISKRWEDDLVEGIKWMLA